MNPNDPNAPDSQAPLPPMPEPQQQASAAPSYTPTPPPVWPQAGVSYTQPEAEPYPQEQRYSQRTPALGTYTPPAYSGMAPPAYPQPGPADTLPAAQAYPEPSSNKRKLLVIIGGVVAIIIVAALAVLFTLRSLNSDARQSLKASNAFIAAVQNKDGNKAHTLLSPDAKANTPISDYRIFVTESGETLSGKYKKTDGKIETSGGITRAYYLYEFADAKHKYVRTVVQKKDAKWGVISFVHSSEKLDLVASGVSASINAAPAAKK